MVGTGYPNLRAPITGVSLCVTAAGQSEGEKDWRLHSEPAPVAAHRGVIFSKSGFMRSIPGNPEWCSSRGPAGGHVKLPWQENPKKKICVHLVIQDTSHRRTPRLKDQRGLNSWHIIPWYRPSLPYFFSSSAPFSSFSPSFFSFLFPLTFLATTAFPKSPIVSPVIVLSPRWVMRKS
jgi:hypothetical protein